MRGTDTFERFVRDIAEHQMRIIREDGVYRHIRFGQPGTSCMHFELITWPGNLCYTGDMGTFVFERSTDIFEFFRRPEHCRYSIDMRYWAEKVTAGDKGSRDNGIQEFSKDKLIRAAWEDVNRFIESQMEEAEELAERELVTRAMNDLRAEVREMLDMADDNDVRCYDAVNEFRFGAEDSDAWKEYFSGQKTFQFHDFWDHDFMEYTHRFEWCCYALSWAMETYDRFKERQAAIRALPDHIMLELREAQADMRWDEPGTETIAGYTSAELDAEAERRHMKCACCSTTTGLHRDLGSGGPYRCNSPDCTVF